MQTIQNDVHITQIHFTPSFSVICSIGKAPFYGTIDIVYNPKEVLLEFVEFETWLHSLSIQQMTVEDLARLTFDTLSAVLGDIPLRVTVNARTTVHSPVSATIERTLNEKL